MVYGYRDDNLRQVSPEAYLQDFEYLCDISNKVNHDDDVYTAARRAARLAQNHYKKGSLSSLMGVMSSSIYKSGTVGSHQFRELERKVANYINKAPYRNVPCSSPECGSFAIARSHTIQRQKVLKTIVDASNSVYQTKQHPDNHLDLLHKVGWKEASTFPGYCEMCEVHNFRDVESSSAVLTRKTASLLIWRAACLTRYRRAVEVKERARIVSDTKAYEIARELDDMTIPIGSAMILKTRISAFLLIDCWLQVFQKSDIGHNKRFWYFAVELEGAPFVVAGAAPIYFDFQEKMLSSPRKFESNAAVLCFASFVVDGKPFIVFGYDNTERKVRKFVEQMRDQSHEMLAAYLPQIVLANCDTVYFSPKWWDNNANELDRHIVFHSVFMGFSRMLFPWWGKIRGLKVVGVIDI
jgi:hypothetical protein